MGTAFFLILRLFYLGADRYSDINAAAGLKSGQLIGKETLKKRISNVEGMYSARREPLLSNGLF